MTKFTVAGQTIESYYADGLGGQYIFVLPQLNAVVAFNGSAYTTEELGQRNIRRIMETERLPAMRP